MFTSADNRDFLTGTPISRFVAVYVAGKDPLMLIELEAKLKKRGIYYILGSSLKHPGCPLDDRLWQSMQAWSPGSSWNSPTGQTICVDGGFLAS